MNVEALRRKTDWCEDSDGTISENGGNDTHKYCG